MERTRCVHALSVLVGSGPEGRTWQGMVGAGAGCRDWRETHWEKGKEGTRSWVPGSSTRFSQCHIPACRDLWSQAPCFPRCSEDDVKRKGGVHSGVKDRSLSLLMEGAGGWNRQAMQRERMLTRS